MTTSEPWWWWREWVRRDGVERNSLVIETRRVF